LTYIDNNRFKTLPALDPSGTKKLREKCKSSIKLAMTLASTEIYNRRHVKPLAEQFNVSVTAMAIRLTELDLFEL
jgi:hypothetical protein